MALGQSRGPGRMMALKLCRGRDGPRVVLALDSCRRGWGRDLCRGSPSVAGPGWLYSVTDLAWPCERDPVKESLACSVTVTVSGLLWGCDLLAD